MDTRKLPLEIQDKIYRPSIDEAEKVTDIVFEPTGEDEVEADGTNSE